jgi:hypothetical protein
MASRAAPKPKKQRPQLNPEMLRWAWRWRGRTLEEAAAKVHKTPAEIAAWEVKDRPPEVKGPTVKQARELAELYDRAFLEFFRTSPPALAEPELVPDYRMHKGAATDTSDVRELKAIQAWAEEKRTNALDLFEEIGEDTPNVPSKIFVTLPTSHETAACSAHIGISD